LWESSRICSGLGYQLERRDRDGLNTVLSPTITLYTELTVCRVLNLRPTGTAPVTARGSMSVIGILRQQPHSFRGADDPGVNGSARKDVRRLGEICSCLGGGSKPICFITIVIAFSGRMDKAQVPHLITAAAAEASR
jgi:hypothetical protein